MYDIDHYLLELTKLLHNQRIGPPDIEKHEYERDNGKLMCYNRTFRKAHAFYLTLRYSMTFGKSGKSDFVN